MGMALAISVMAPITAYADDLTVFSDNFAIKNTSLWTWGAGASVSNGELVLACESDYHGQIVTPVPYDLTDSAFTAQLTTPPAVGGGHTETGLIASANPGDVETASAYMVWEAGELINSQTINWNTTEYFHGGGYAPGLWLRIRHSSATGLLYWEKSTDGTKWSTISSAAPAFNITKVWLTIQCGYWMPEMPSSAIYRSASLIRIAVPLPPS